MSMGQRAVSAWAGAACVVLGFGALFVGRVMMYPTALVPGSTLERIRAEAVAWDHSHRVMLAGFVLLIPASVALWTALRARSAWASFAGAWLLIVAAALSVGQFALDFANLEAARALSPEAGQQFMAAMRANGFVRLAFYSGPDLGGFGVLLLAVAMFRQGRGWWWVAGGVLAAAIALSVVDSRMGPVGPRVTLGVQWVGFTLAAWLMVRRAARDQTK